MFAIGNDDEPAGVCSIRTRPLLNLRVLLTAEITEMILTRLTYQLEVFIRNGRVSGTEGFRTANLTRFRRRHIRRIRILCVTR